MKKLSFLFASVYLALSLAAQMPMMPSNNGKMQAPPSIGRIYGKLVDSSGKGVKDASVIILQNRLDSATHKMKEVFLKGVSTQSNGDFNIEGLPIFGQLKLNITAVGFKPIVQKVAFEIKMPAGQMKPPANGQMPDMSAIASNFEKDLGKISLETDAQQMQNVIVTATASGRLKMDIDKKVFNVGQNIVSAGGTAVDVMKNVPSVNVDIDGKVTLRNATPQIYIDGRPTTLTLDQIPADAIESVEVITNPSAKYDASGGNAGILNIVLKKNRKSGYNGMVMAGVDKRGGLNGGANFNVRQNKLNFSVATFTNQMKNRNTSSTDVRNLLASPNLLVSQNGLTHMNGGFLFGKVGVDYFATNRTTFSLAGIRVHGSFNPSDFLQTDSTFEGGPYVSYSERYTTNHREFNAYGLQGSFKYSFPKKGEELTADANLFSGKNNNNSLYNTNVYTANGGNEKATIQQQIIGSGTNQFFTAQTDYVNPLKNNGKLEAGVRVQLRNLENHQGNYYFDASSGKFIPVSSASANYRNNDDVYAAYLSVTKSIKNFGYQAGVRAESSNYVGELTDTKEKFTNKYPVSLFPSVFLSQKLKKQQEVQLSYTRRINRPFFMQIIPFIDSTNQLNWTRGNAGLRPEFTNSLEASYSKTLKNNNTIMGSVYYKYTTDLITQYVDTITTASNIKRPITTYINANSSRSMGVELTSQNTLLKWWDVNTNLNFYNSKINTGNVTGIEQNALWSWFAKMNNNFKLPKNYKIQLSGTYQSKTNLPVNQGGGFGPGGGGPPMGAQTASQGYIKSNYGVDVALQKSFLKNNAASLTLSVNDIFRTRRYDLYSESPFFIQNSHRLNDAPMIRLNFSFRFGQMDMSLFKRKDNKDESMQNATQSMGQ